MATICIKRNPKRMVRDPETGIELDEKREYTVEDSPYWRRRLQSKDVIEVEAKASKAKTKSEEPPAPSSEPAAALENAQGDEGEVKKEDEKKTSSKSTKKK